jgi:hypothetical protein
MHVIEFTRTRLRVSAAAMFCRDVMRVDQVGFRSASVRTASSSRSGGCGRE